MLVTASFVNFWFHRSSFWLPIKGGSKMIKVLSLLVVTPSNGGLTSV